MSRTTQRQYAVGDVLDETAAEPVEGTLLLGADGEVHGYDGAGITGRWEEYRR